MKLTHHILYWLIVAALLTLFFGQEKGDYIQAFYFTTYLLPIAIGTTYFFTYYLLPTYLLAKRYGLFALYFFYTLIISLYLEMLVAVAAFVILANYQFQNMNSVSVDTFTMGIIIYLIVFFSAFIELIRRFFGQEKEIISLSEKKEANEQKMISIRVDRRLVPLIIDSIVYIESLADYVKVHTTIETHITKEKISKLEATLPDTFIRIHRSYLVNSPHIRSFTKESVLIGEDSLPISRSYKAKVIDQLMKD